MRTSILRCRVAARTATFMCLGPRRTVATIAGRSYNDAVDALNSLQTPFALIEAKRKAGIRHDEAAMAEMQTYLKRIGYSPEDLNSINIVHVAGTKGKGSTCAFIDSILGRYREKQLSLRKSGLFISPHLISVRERIRINSKPIPESLFAKYFFEVWDRLGNSTVDAGAVPLGTRPLYGRYLTLMSWHVFLQEGVDVAVYETGLGGQFDATNLVSKPLATGITTLGIDHVQVLGHTIEEIAWHKAGIMKTGSPAYTVPQIPAAIGVLDKVAAERGVDMKKLELDTRLSGVRVQPDAEFQKMNASLAIALAEEALKKTHALDFSADPLPTEFVDGIEQTVFRGRCEVKTESAVTWYIDGAHTADSLRVSSEWFAKEANKSPGPRILIFNQQGRSEAVDFLEPLFNASKRPSDGTEKRPLAFDHVIFCTNLTYADVGYKRDFVDKQVDAKEVEQMTVQHRFAEKWASLDPTADVRVIRSIEEALAFARSVGQDLDPGQKAQAYVTGSIHLVGGALGILENVSAL